MGIGVIMAMGWPRGRYRVGHGHGVDIGLAIGWLWGGYKIACGHGVVIGLAVAMAWLWDHWPWPTGATGLTMAIGWL